MAGALPAGALQAGAAAQEPSEAETDTIPVYEVDPLVVTATRTPRPVSLVPVPMTAITPRILAEKTPNTVADLFRDLPGLDVNGVGANQVRPIIRGQRGQRVLLLADGLRLNNSRRQQDFGELPALVDVSSVQRVEVVRGPASVLYGTDAIGGVVNVITSPPETDGLRGSARYLYGSAASNHKGSVRLVGGFGKFHLAGGATYRDAGWYDAPSGSFGAITLDRGTTVQDTGVRDRSLDLRLGYRIAPTHQVFGKVEIYDADHAGFGYVDPAAYAPEEAEIRITYPFQEFNRFTIGYSGSELGTLPADRLDVQAYLQRNERRLDFDLFTSFGIPDNPAAGITIANQGYTDVGTTGFRIEARKLAASPLLLTYGVDFFRDDSENDDVSVTTVSGFGPPDVTTDSTPSLPFATYRALGVFAQGELALGSRATLIAGARYQDLKAESRTTPGLDLAPATDVNRTLVGALNGIVRVTGDVSLVGTLGRGFRAPNLIELFFEGPTPEGSGYQLRNPDLKPEKSFNVDLGVRYRSDLASAEAFVFRNRITDGIRTVATGEEVDGVDAYTNVNIDELVSRGFEMGADVFLPAGFTVGGSWTHLSEEDPQNPERAVGQSYSTKLTGRARWSGVQDRLWLEYGIRHNGEQKDVSLIDNPVGDVFPAFTVHDLRAGAVVWRTASGQPQRLVLAVQNLTDVLYAEFSNASFFRPQPGRNVTLSMELSF